MLAILTRLSRENEISSSIENQTREGLAFAKSNNFNHIIYNEGEGVSGTLDVKDRPVLQRLIKDIISGKITAIWMRNQNRMERNSLTFHLLVDLVKKKNIKLFFGNGDEIDFNDPKVFLSNSVLSILNSYSAQLQSAQTKQSLKDNVAEGKIHGILPYGYTSDENKYVQIDPEESEIVKRIYALSLSGIGTKSIAEILNNEDVPTRYNKIGKGTVSFKNKYTGKTRTVSKKSVKWDGQTVRGIIINTFYMGRRVFSGSTYNCPIIIEPEYWNEVNENLKKNANNTGVKVSHKYLLKGVLECAKCGRNYYGRTRVNKKDNYYMCSSKRYKDKNCGNRSINIDVLDTVIWSLFSISDDYLGLIKESIKESSKSINKTEILKNIGFLEKKINSLKNEKSRAISLAIKDLLDEEDLKPEIIRINTEKSKTEIELLKLKNKIRDIEDQEKSISLIEKDITSLHANASFEKKKEAITKYIKRIYIRYFPQSNMYNINVLTNTEMPLSESIYMDWNYNIAVFSRNNKVLEIKEGISPEKEQIIYDRMVKNMVKC